MQEALLFVVVGIVGLFALIVLAGVALLVRPWLRALMYGTPVSVFDVLGMRLRGNPPVLLIDAYIALHRAGVSVTIRDVETVYVDNRNRISTSDSLVELVQKSVKAR